mmetsp:Transcript_343/g.667  ORF Transcript_343/g.667 Transcript_343/m.667 type:complete len:286 (-) Transcript_343:1774-2631(-)
MQDLAGFQMYTESIMIWSLMSKKRAVQSLPTDMKMRSLGMGATESTWCMCPRMHTFFPHTAHFQGHRPPPPLRAAVLGRYPGSVSSLLWYQYTATGSTSLFLTNLVYFISFTVFHQSCWSSRSAFVLALSPLICVSPARPATHSPDFLKPNIKIELFVVPSSRTPSTLRSLNDMCVAGAPHTPFAGLSSTRLSSQMNESNCSDVDQSMALPVTRLFSLGSPLTSNGRRSTTHSGFFVSRSSGSQSLSMPPIPAVNKPTPSTYNRPSTSALCACSIFDDTVPLLQM